MSLSDAIDDVKTILEGIGLVYTPDERDTDLLSDSVGRGKFDGSFLIAIEADPRELRELSLDPEVWMETIRIEVGTELTNEVLENQKTAGERARQVQDALWNPSDATYPNICRIDPLGPGSLTQDDRKMVWKKKYQLTYSE